MGIHWIMASSQGAVMGETDGTDGSRPAANVTTDNKFTETIGRKADTANSGAIATTKSIIAYIKQVVNLLLGDSGERAVNKTLLAPTSGTATPITVASTGGSCLIKTVSIQVTTAETNATAANSILLTSDDTSPLSQPITTKGGITLYGGTSTTPLAIGNRYVEQVNHILAVGKVLKLTQAARTTGVYTVTVTYLPLASGAALTAVA